MKKIAFAFAIALTAALTANVAQAQPESGLLLGITAFPNSQGLRVTGTLPGYSAEGRLLKNDVLLRVSDGTNTFTTRSGAEMEFAKDQIGPDVDAALELFRPGEGVVYLWVTFSPVEGTTQYAFAGKPVKAKSQARFYTESEKPGAAKMFKKPTGPVGGTVGGKVPGGGSAGVGGKTIGGGKAGGPKSFFNK